MQIQSTKGLHSSQVKALIYSNSGVGKTSLLGTLPEHETIILSAESGLLCLSDKDIAVITINSWTDVRRAYKMVSSPECAKYKYIGIDSLTEIAERLVVHLESLPEFKDPKNTIKMWGEYTKKMTAIVKAFRDLPGKHTFFTALTEDVLDGGHVIKKPFIKGASAQRLLASWLDEVLYLDIMPNKGEEGGKRMLQTQPSASIQAKDRSGKLDDYEEANLMNLINKIQGK